MRQRPDPERIKSIVLHICLVLWLLACVAMGALAYVRHNHPDSPWARWQAAAARAEAAHRLQLLQQARTRNERDYIAFVQGQCGPEAWYRPREGAAPVCTDKRGRATGQPYEGAQP